MYFTNATPFVSITGDCLVANYNKLSVEKKNVLYVFTLVTEMFYWPKTDITESAKNGKVHFDR